MTIDLSPGSASFSDYHVDYDEIDINSVEWWRRKIPALQAAEELELTDAQKPPRCNREVVGGAFPPGYEGVTRDAVITAKFTYKLVSDNAAESQYKEVPQSVTLQATDEVQQDWHILESSTAAEDPPDGLAQHIYESVAELQYEGQVDLNEREVRPLAWHPGQLLNMTDGRADWVSARAQLQRVSFDLDHGRTTLTLGPTKMLGATDLVELLRAARQRSISNYAGARITGAAPGNKSKDGGQTANRSTSSSEAFIKKRVMVGGEGETPQHKITIDADVAVLKLEVLQTGSRMVSIALDDIATADTVKAGGKIELKLRKIKVCDNEEEKSAYALISEPFDEEDE
jgi:hypothetical protein